MYTPVEKGQSFATNTFVIRKLNKQAKKKKEEVYKPLEIQNITRWHVSGITSLTDALVAMRAPSFLTKSKINLR